MTIELVREGRRTYFIGNTFSVKDVIKGNGGHWDADRKAWWIGSHEKAQAIVGAAVTAKPVASYTKVGDAWCIRAPGLVVGEAYEVAKRDSTKNRETVTRIVRTEADGMVIAEIAPRTKAATPAFKRTNSNRGGYRYQRTGCWCGSLEGCPRDSDCASCQHDA